MTIKDLLDMRDEAIRVRILALLPSDNEDLVVGVNKVLDEAFTNGEKDWQRYLEAYYSELEASLQKTMMAEFWEGHKESL